MALASISYLIFIFLKKKILKHSYIYFFISYAEGNWKIEWIKWYCSQVLVMTTNKMKLKNFFINYCMILNLHILSIENKKYWFFGTMVNKKIFWGNHSTVHCSLALHTNFCIGTCLYYCNIKYQKKLCIKIMKQEPINIF